MTYDEIREKVLETLAESSSDYLGAVVYSCLFNTARSQTITSPQQQNIGESLEYIYNTTPKLPFYVKNIHSGICYEILGYSSTLDMMEALELPLRSPINLAPYTPNYQKITQSQSPQISNYSYDKTLHECSMIPPCAFPFYVEDNTGDQYEVQHLDLMYNAYLCKHLGLNVMVYLDPYRVAYKVINNPYVINLNTSSSGSIVLGPVEAKALNQSLFDMCSEIEKKCECGAEAAGLGGHSSWCPKFEEMKC